jgi:hypothetical protein
MDEDSMARVLFVDEGGQMQVIKRAGYEYYTGPGLECSDDMLVSLWDLE